MFEQKMPVATAEHYNLLDYNFSDFHLDDDDTLKATIRMFLDLDLIEAFHINYEVQGQWHSVEFICVCVCVYACMPMM